MPYIISELWKKYISKPIMTLNRCLTYLESCFGHVVSLVYANNNSIRSMISLVLHRCMATFCKFKASISFHQLIPPKNLKWLPYTLKMSLYIISRWFIILNKNNFVKVDHHYLTLGRKSGLFIANVLWTHWHVLSE